MFQSIQKNIKLQSIMIQFSKTNDKGDTLKAYTHQGYLSSHYTTEIIKAEKNAQTRAQVIGYGASLLTYYALDKVPQLNNFIKAKFLWKGSFLVTSFVFGQLLSLGASIIFASGIRNRHENLLKNEVFPAWFNKERVVNPDRVFFELDDNHNNEPTIWHSAITPSTIQRLVPDFIVGNPHKPHPPVAEEHHH